MSKTIWIICLCVGWALKGAALSKQSILYIRAANSATVGIQMGIDPMQYYKAQNVYRDWILNRDGYQVEIRSDKEIPKKLEKYDLIVLPEIVCLSDGDREKLLKYVENGGGLFLSGGTGSYTPSGEWIGYTFLERLLGSRPEPTKEYLNPIEALHFRYGPAGTLALPPGYFLPISFHTTPLALPEAHSVEVLAYWSEAVLGNKDAKEVPREIGFVVREFQDGGRIAWVGADLDGIDQTQARRALYIPFFHQLFDWLCGGATVGIEPWPYGKKRALLIHGDIETNFHLVENILEPLRKYRVKSTFNLLMSEAEKVPRQLIEDLRATGGELGSHAYEHNHFWGQPFQVQMERLKRLKEASHKYQFDPVGLRPPYLAHDDSTLEALRQMDMIYLTADRFNLANYPRVVYGKGEHSKKGVVLFPKGELDDYDVFYVLKTTEQSEVTRLFMQDFQRLRDCRALYQFNYHSQFLNTPQLAITLDTLLSVATRDQEMWIATAEEIARWILARDQLRLHYESQNGRLRVIVKNEGLDLTFPGYLKILPPLAKKQNASSSEKWETSKKDREKITYRQDIRPNREGLVPIPMLKAGETFAFELDYWDSYSTTNLRVEE